MTKKKTTPEEEIAQLASEQADDAAGKQKRKTLATVPLDVKNQHRARKLEPRKRKGGVRLPKGLERLPFESGALSGLSSAHVAPNVALTPLEKQTARALALIFCFPLGTDLVHDTGEDNELVTRPPAKVEPHLHTLIRTTWRQWSGFEVEDVWMWRLLIRLEEWAFAALETKLPPRTVKLGGVVHDVVRDEPETDPRALHRRVRDDLEHFGFVSAKLPPWLTPSRVAWLATRFSLGRGGSSKVSRGRVIELLRDPKTLQNLTRK